MAPPSTKSQVLRSFNVADFPALRGLEEEWRFTPLKRLGELVTATALTGSAPTAEYGDLPPGVSIKDVDQVEDILTPFDRISALAYGSAAGVTLIEVAPETELAEPLVIRLVGKGGKAAAARTYVKVGNFAKATVVLEQTGTTTLADNIEVVLGDSAQLTFVTLAEWDADAVQAQHVKFRVGKIVYVAFSRDETVMGFGFPKEERAALVGAEPQIFHLPRESDLRFNWVQAWLAELAEQQMTELVLDAWRMVVPKKVWSA